MKINLLKIIRAITITLETVSSTLARKWAIKLFFSPRTSRQRVPDIPGLEKHWYSYTRTDGSQSRCRVYTAGNGPSVLLVHGWEGSAWSMSTIAKQLLEKNLRVVLFDYPAHGFSPGKKTNLMEVSSIIQNISARENGLYALVSHSLGAVCSGHAIKSGINPNHFISIGAPTSMDYIVDVFCSMIGASEATKKGLIDRIEEILQGPYKEDSLSHMAQKFDLKGLIIHDKDDRMVPYSHAKELSDVWGNSRVVTTEKLGHNRILKNDAVIQSIAANITA